MAEDPDNKPVNKTPDSGSVPDEGTPDPVNKGTAKPPEVTPPETNPLDEAKKINEETAKLNAERTKILEREEKLQAEKMVGGRGEVIPKTEKKPLTDSEYWGKIKKGENPDATG